MKRSAPGLHRALWRAYLVEVGATAIYRQQSRAGTGPFAARLAAFSEQEAMHAAELAALMEHTGARPGPRATGIARVGATILGWLLARLGRRFVMWCDLLLERRGLRIYAALLAQLPADAEHDRRIIRGLVAIEEDHAAALAAWRRGVPIA